MSTRHLRNISLSKYQSFLELIHCKRVSFNGGHEKWVRSDLLRPITVQTHVDPVPERIIKQVLLAMGYSKDDFHDILACKKEVVKEGDDFKLIDTKK